MGGILARWPRYLSNYERSIRVQKVMKLKGWSWYKLSAEMRREQTTVQRVFKNVDRGCTRDVKLSIILACAIALEVSAGFLVDRRPAGLAANKRSNDDGE